MWRPNLRSHTLSVVPCAATPGFYRWVIRTPDGARETRSLYPFATRDGARISGEFWKREYDSAQAKA